MTPEEFAQLQQQFLSLREMTDIDRERRLTDMATDQPAVAAELRQLIMAESDSQSLLEQPLASLVSAEQQAVGSVPEVSDGGMQTTHKFPAVAENPDVPGRIGPYRIFQQIGEGGHGMVFMAEQREPIRRKVALKLIKPGMESKIILARFEAERQALALMKHPSIANVIDAGTSESGSPYFVMELVHGTPIDQFCRENQLSLTATLKLFQQVCDAVHHAHRKGIIHRDIKPANVLVTVDSGQPLPKVIDFGIAKAMHLTLTEQTMFTEYGQIIGTLEYMSPEQAMMSQDEADVRSDVYSLGVLLYVLLTGSPPISKQQLLANGLFELRNALNDIRPPTPSLRLTGGQQARTWREQNESEKRKWLNRLKGDLDWITMKALEKVQDQRYDSVAAFSLDIDRFLSSEEVLARPPSLAYKISCWIRRHRTVATLLGGLLACLVVSFAAITWGFLKSQQNLAESEKQRERADANAKKLTKRLNREILETAWLLARDGDADATMRQLNQIAVDDRGYAWRFVEAARQQDSSSPIRDASEEPVRQMALHEASGQLAVITTDSALELRRLADGFLIRKQQLDPALYNCLEFNADGTQLLFGAGDWLQTMKVSDYSLSEKVQHRRGGTRSASFDSRTNAWFVSTGANFLVKFDANPLAVGQATELPARLGLVRVLPRIQRVAVATLDGTVFVVDSDNPGSVTTIEGADMQLVDIAQFGDQLLGVNYSGRRFSVEWSSDDPPAILRFKTSEETTVLEGQAVEATIAGPETLLISTRGGSVKVRNRDHATMLVRQYSTSIVEQLLTSDALVLRHFDGRISRLSLKELGRSKASSRINGMTDGLSLSSDGVAVTAHSDGVIRLWDNATGDQIAQRKVHDADVFSIDANSDGTIVASFGADWHIRLSDGRGLGELRSLPASGGVRPVVVSHSGELLAGAPDRTNLENLREGTIDLWDLEGGNVRRRLVGHENWVIQIQFSSDDSRLVSLGVDGTLRVWDVDSGQLQQTLDFGAESPVNCFAMYESEDQILCGHHDGSLSLWDIHGGKIVSRHQLRPEQIVSVAIPGSSKIAVVRSEDSPSLTFFDADVMAPVAEFDLGIGSIKGFRMGRQDQHLQVLGESGTTRLLRLP